MATISIDVSVINESTTGASDGEINIITTTDPTPAPGTLYTYSINKGGVVTSASTASDVYTFTGLAPGVYQCFASVDGTLSRGVTVPIATASPTPDPEPPIPPVPIVYEYRETYTGSFCDKKGVNILVSFKRRVPIDTIPSEPIPIQFAGENDSPIVIDYPDNGDYKLTPVNGSQCEIKIKAIGSFELSSMYTADEKEWRVDISGGWKWSGFLIPDSCIEPFMSKPYDVSVRATDALGLLKDEPFQQIDATRYKGYYADKEILRICLEKTGLALSMYIGVNTYEGTMAVGSQLSPMGQSYANTEPFLNEDGTAMDCYSIMESVLSRWGCRLHQFNGVWQIVNVMEQSLDVVNTFSFNTSGGADGGQFALGNFVRVGGQNRAIKPVGDTSFAKAFKQSAAYYKYGYISNALYNGDFDIWTSKPAGLPNGWIMTGGTTGTTKIRYENGYPTSDYYIEIDTNNGGGIQNVTPVQIRQYDFPKISFDLYAPDTLTYGPTPGRYISVFISNNDGLWFTEDGWKNTNRAYVTKKSFGDFAKQLQIQITVDPLDEDYLMTITILAVGLADGTHFKTNINNVNLNAGFGTGREKNAIGETNEQVLLTKQSFIPEVIEVLHSDDTNETRTSGLKISSTEDGLKLANPAMANFSSLWKRNGITEFAPLLRIIANSELRLHQRAYRIIDFEYVTDWTSLSTDKMDINTLLAVDLLDGYFIFLSGSFDLKSGIPRLKFAQVLTEEVMVNETLKMDYGD